VILKSGGCAAREMLAFGVAQSEMDRRHNKDGFTLSKRRTRMNERTRVQPCEGGECGPAPLSLPLPGCQTTLRPPAAKGPDYRFITTCHYSDAINGNELADN